MKFHSLATRILLLAALTGVMGRAQNEPAAGNVFADEPRMLNDLRHIPGCEHCQAAFRLWLREQGVTPRQVGFDTWEDVRASLPVHEGPVEARRLNWYTHLFAIETGPLPFRYATQAIQEAYGRPVQTSINPSMGAVAGARMASDGNGWSFPALGRTGATTIPWTEDWPSTATGSTLAGAAAACAFWISPIPKRPSSSPIIPNTAI